MPTDLFVAVDIGNARIKLGLFASGCAEALPDPLRTLSVDGDAPDLHPIATWLDTDATLSWWIASVNRPLTTRLVDWLCGHRPDDRVTLLAVDDLPLVVQLERPDMVGIDRLVDAVAANRLREPTRPAVIVDVGTAITVDLLAADGAFQGGAILPGLRMSARALHEFTDLLPLVDASDLATPPPALGVTTASALQAGLFWGTIGAVRQLIAQLTGDTGRNPSDTAPRPQVFLTGGAGPMVADLLGRAVRQAPHLTLSGIAVTATLHQQRGP